MEMALVSSTSSYQTSKAFPFPNTLFCLSNNRFSSAPSHSRSLSLPFPANPGRCRALTPGPPPPPQESEPPPEPNSIIVLAGSFFKLKDKIQILFAVLFWMSLFFWASAFDDRSKPGINMLLRSSSAPILNSWPTHSKDYSSSESEPALIRTKSISYSSSFLSPFLNDDPIKKAHSALSEVDFHIPPKPKKNNFVSHCLRKQPTLKIKDCCEEQQQEKLRVDSKLTSSSSSSTLERLFSSSGLGEKDLDHEECVEGKKEEALLALDIDGGAGGEGGSRRGRKGSEGEDNDGSGFFESNSHGSDNTDAYYQNMIVANPGNPLLLGNYAKFLKEVRKDYAKAEEYCERAILTNPNDGNILSLYADLVWRIHKDATRAEKYFEQAVKTSPDDCYVQASYAHFLWDAEDDEDKEEEDQHKRENVHTNPAPFFHGASFRKTITAKQQHRRLTA